MQIAQRVQRGTLHGADQIGLAIGPALKRYKVKKHFAVQITDTSFTYQRKIEQIETEAALDGIYVLRTSVPDTELSHRRGRALLQEPRTGRAGVQAPSKAPSSRSARSTTTSKTASARTCSSACSPTTSPGIYASPGRRCSSKTRHHQSKPTHVAKATRSQAAQQKARTKRTSAGDRCHSYKSLLAELATLTRNTIRLPGTNATFHKLAQPTTLQARALDLTAHAPLDP